MVDSEQMKVLLVRRLNRFLAKHGRNESLLETIVARIQSTDCRAVVLGGMLRDLLLKGRTRNPRDVDIVIEDTTGYELRRLFADLGEIRSTRFGGLHIDDRRGGWSFDIWPLQDTWAFKVLDWRPISFGELPKTTFLNLDAIAVEIAPVLKEVPQVYSRGFFEAVSTRTLDINLDVNPFPAVCTVRSLVIASDVSFRLSRKLATYIVNTMSSMPVENLIAAQVSHYGRIYYRVEALLQAAQWIEDQLESRALSIGALPEHCRMAG